ncbi:MAG: hypothetical protein ACRCU5_12405 [Rhizobiaceae bacterium]
MVVPIVGFPAGQSVERDGIVVTLTYFNRCLVDRMPDGKVTFMITNLSDVVQAVNVSLTIATDGSDFFQEKFRLTESVEPRSVAWLSFQNDKIKTASFAKFAVMSDFARSETPHQITLADYVDGKSVEYVEVASR